MRRRRLKAASTANITISCRGANTVRWYYTRSAETVILVKDQSTPATEWYLYCFTLGAVRMVLGHVLMIWMHGAEIPGHLCLG